MDDIGRSHFPYCPSLVTLNALRWGKPGISMLTCETITLHNVKRMKACYQAFQQVAETEYRWDMAAIPFDGFQIAIGQKILEGCQLLQNKTGYREPQVVGFALFKQEPHGAIEMNVIHVEEGLSKKAALDRMMRFLIEQWLQREGWDVVSYAMLGVQQELVYTLTWYGFKPMGQTIVRLDLVNPLTSEILKRQKKIPDLPEGYELVSWSDAYANQTAKVVYEAFKHKSDALWDPRFRTEEGARNVVRFMASGEMGKHLSSCTSLLLKATESGKQVVGFCFLLNTDVGQANVPLVGVLPEEAGKGFGVELMRHTVFRAVDEIVAGRLGLSEINATLDTDNGPAIKMYRRFGFEEDDNYPHSYLTRQMAEQLEAGQWCEAPPYEKADAT